jgi:hypothetical protein
MRDVTPKPVMSPGNSGAQPGGGGQGPFQGMTIQNVIGAIKQHAPGISDEALGMAVDRFMPMLSADAQFQWRQMVDAREQRRIAGTEAWRDRRGDQFDAGLQIKRDQMDAVNDRFHEREARLREKEAKTNFARLSPEQATQQKFFSQKFNETAHSARSAYDALTRLQSYNGKPEDVAAAQEAYTRADALRWAAQEDYERFLDTVKPSAAAPAALPAPTQPVAKPAAKPADAPPPGYIERTPGPQSSLENATGMGTGTADFDPQAPESPQHAARAARMATVRDRDEASPMPASTLPPPRRLSPAELENYATGGQNRLSQMTPEQRIAAVGDRGPKLSRGRPGELNAIDRTIAEIEPRRRQSRRTVAAAYDQGYNETDGLNEENAAATEQEKHDILFRLAQTLGIVVPDYLNPPDKTKFKPSRTDLGRSRASTAARPARE